MSEGFYYFFNIWKEPASLRDDFGKEKQQTSNINSCYTMSIYTKEEWILRLQPTVYLKGGKVHLKKPQEIEGMNYYFNQSNK